MENKNTWVGKQMDFRIGYQHDKDRVATRRTLVGVGTSISFEWSARGRKWECPAAIALAEVKYYRD